MDRFDIDSFNRFLQSSKMGRRIVYMDTTGSTMDDARRLGRDVKEYPHGTVVMSERQTKARGAKDHKWDATNTGNIYVSLVLHLPPVYKTFEGSFDLEVAACLAVLQVVKKFGVTKAIPKWPNDLWVKGHKLAGFLVEDGRFDIPGSTNCLLILGMGINVNADIRRCSELQSVATSMVCERKGHYVHRERLMAEVCLSLEQMLASKREDHFRQFLRENLFQENLEISASDLLSGKVLDGKFKAICKNWDVAFTNTQTEETVRGSSEVFSIRPKVLCKIMIVFSSIHNTSMAGSLSKWLTAVMDTSRYVICLVPESTVTLTDEWMKTCSLLVLLEDVCEADLVNRRLSYFLRSGGSVMASGKGSAFLGKLLHIHHTQVMLGSPGDSVVLIRLQTESLCLSPPDSDGNQFMHVGDTPSPVGDTPSPVGDTPSTVGDTPSPVGDTPSPALILPEHQPRTVVFPSDPMCFQYQLNDVNDLCLEDLAAKQSGQSDSISKIEVKAYIHDTDSRQLTVFAGCLKSGGRVAIWGFNIVNVWGRVSIEDVKTVDDDRFKRDFLLQTVLDSLLRS